ncbi:MAG: anaerobic sulfatase maturase [Firmicutes bacterium]|nr:anaerobic sulfatase maturase [Bacillota bacterium]
MLSLFVLIKPASGDCNLRCEYCFVHLGKAQNVSEKRHRMSTEVLEHLISRCLEYSERQCIFGWQGGEPLLMGLDFFRQALRLQDKYRRRGQEVFNCIQTNAILLTEEWATFFKENRFLVGVSLDGPKEEHDRYRLDVAGRGSYNRVMQGINLLKRCGADFNILAVVNNYTARHPMRIYNFLRSQGFSYLQFIPCIERNPRTGDLAAFSVTPEDYAQFLKVIFTQWIEDLYGGHRISIQLFDNLVQALLGVGPDLCILRGRCDGKVVVDYDGGAYPCDFYVEDEWRLGNIMEQSLEEMINSPLAKIFYNRASAFCRPPRCKDCRWFDLCHGGCPRNRGFGNGDAAQVDFLCDAYREFFPVAVDTLVDLINQHRLPNYNAYRV